MRCFGLLKNDIFGFLRKKEIKYAQFNDPLGNFKIAYLENWKFDADMVVFDGGYSLSFSSPDSQSTFTIFVDAKIMPKSNLRGYASRELESPESGIYAKMRETSFFGTQAYQSDYDYHSGNTPYFGGSVIFSGKKAIYRLSWCAPLKNRPAIENIFSAMKKSLIVTL